MMTKPLDPKNTLLLVALEKELPKKILPTWNIYYTGVGKVNAALSVVQAYNLYKPNVIINYGTVGSLNPKLSGLIKVNKFFQRDMDVRPLGFEYGETPFDKVNTISLDYEGFSCGTGDNFAVEKQIIQSDVVDMESYSIAKFCYINKIKFICYKYITDNADENSPENWNLNIEKGAELFTKTLNDLI